MTDVDKPLKDVDRPLKALRAAIWAAAYWYMARELSLASSFISECVRRSIESCVVVDGTDLM